MKPSVFKGPVRLVVMPDDGVETIKRLIDEATSSISVKLFEFQTRALIQALIESKARGLDIKVMLNEVRGNGVRPNDATLQTLRDHGFEASWTSPLFPISHEKSVVLDDRHVLIATFNFSDKYFTQTRDYGLLIEDPSIVREIRACFDADRQGVAFVPPEGSPLAWGNANARHAVCAFIDAVDKHLHIQQPKFHDVAVLDRILAARDRGVSVHLLCGGHSGIEMRDIVDTFANQRILERAGVRLRKQHGLKLHAKIMLADGKRAMLGSMNIDREAYDTRRELGIVFDDKTAVAALQATFDDDWYAAKHYSPQDPLEPFVKGKAGDRIERGRHEPPRGIGRPA